LETFFFPPLPPSVKVFRVTGIIFNYFLIVHAGIEFHDIFFNDGGNFNHLGSFMGSNFLNHYNEEIGLMLLLLHVCRELLLWR
jgi:hypothetical protein